MRLGGIEPGLTAKRGAELHILADANYRSGFDPFGPNGAPTGVSGVVQAQHRYASEGTYTVMLRLTDQDGGIGVDSFVVTVPIPWHNFSNPLDVDDSRDVSPLDVLVIINDLNLNSSRRLPAGQNPLDQRKYIDVDDDGFATALDALLVINFLNRHRNAEGESPYSLARATVISPEAADILLADLSWLDGLEEKRTRSKRNLKLPIGHDGGVIKAK